MQTAEVSNAIWKSYTGIYVLGYGVAVAILFFVYPLTKAKTTEMLEQLKPAVQKKRQPWKQTGSNVHENIAGIHEEPGRLYAARHCDAA